MTTVGVRSDSEYGAMESIRVCDARVTTVTIHESSDREYTCDVCDRRLLLPSNGGCSICFHGPEKGLLVHDRTACTNYVHRTCLDWFGVDSYVEYERCYIDTLEAP